ncbi:hypothetical protein EV360DRAFT_66402 [Lentinula raphanica]|nr:hypothetical protein EV360DRAFT_66402 [Lentinula raphanica]
MMIRSSRRVFVTFFAFLAAVGNITQVAAAPTGYPGGGGIQGTSLSPSHPNKPVTAIYEEILLGKVVPEDEHQARLYAQWIKVNIGRLPEEQKEVFLHQTEEERLAVLRDNMHYFDKREDHDHGDRRPIVQLYLGRKDLDSREQITVEKMELEVYLHFYADGPVETLCCSKCTKNQPVDS